MKEEYVADRDALNVRIEDSRVRLAESQKKKQDAEAADDFEVKRFMGAYGKYSNQTELINDMVRVSIESVLIYELRRIEIVWKFSDGIRG